MHLCVLLISGFDFYSHGSQDLCVTLEELSLVRRTRLTTDSTGFRFVATQYN